MASLITLPFEMEFSALEPLNIDIQTQYIPLKPPLDKDNLWREFPPAGRWGLFASQILKYSVEMAPPSQNGEESFIAD